MTKTTHYNLNKPEAGDPIRVADFNQNSDIIDAALKNLNTAVGTKAEQSAVNALNTAIAAGVKLEIGSYMGTGTYGRDNPTTLTFSFPPKVVGIVADSAGAVVGGTLFVAGQSKSSSIGSVYNSGSALKLILTWSGNSVSWYDNDTYGNTTRQLNNDGATYHYFVLG